MKCLVCKKEKVKCKVYCSSCYDKQWREINKEKSREYKKKYWNQIRFGGNRQKVLERDNWECQKCGMSQKQHIILFDRELNIHHISGGGRNCNDPNNDLDNLEALCFKCHRERECVRE